MKLNNKGFTFVEILAVIAIIAILTSISIVGVSKYKEQAKNKDYEALAKSSYNAMEEYLMSHPYESGASLETLEKDNLLSNRKDPASKENDCNGSVVIVKNPGSDGKLDDGNYTVYLCCVSHMKKYTYPDGKVEDMTAAEKASKCNYTAPEPEDPTDPTVTCSAGNYLPKNTLSCKQCLSAYYCPGGTFNYNASKDQGINKCSEKAAGYAYSNAGSDAVNDCYMKVSKNYYIKKAKDKTATACATGTYKDAHNVFYGKVSSCSNESIVVTFNCNGGTGGGSQTFYSNKTGQGFSTSCSKTGYTQDGWKKDKTATKRDYTTNNGVTENWILTYKPKITLYAHWKINSYKCNVGYYLKKSGTSCTKCIANYYCPGGTFNYNTSKDQGINKCSEKAAGYAYSNAGSDATNDCYMKVSKNYYIKKAKDKTSTKCATGTYKDAHNVNYGKISSCTVKSTKVTFNCNGGTGGGSQTFYSNKTGQKFSTTCTKTGYNLAGWKKVKTATKRDYSATSNVTENFVLTTTPKITLYAHWEPKCVQIKLFKNDGTNSTVGPYSYCIGSTLNQLGYTSTGTFRYANKYQFGNWNHQKKGNSILGWSTNKNATTASYANPNNNERAYWKVPDSFIIANSGKTINFYAIYHTTRAYIHYSANGGKFNTTYMPPGLVHDDGVPYWKTGMFRYWVGRTVTIDGVSYNQVAHIRYADESTFTILRDEMLYGDTAYFHGSGLTDYDWEYFMYITNSSANAAPYDKEWKCISSNCRGKLYSENKSNYVSTDFCNSDYTDCSIVLAVNWQ